MKVVITVQQDNESCAVDMRFGRASFFCLVDTEKGSMEFIGNKQNLNSAQGAGIQAALNVVGTGAEAVLTGHCGPKAFNVLTKSNISVYTGVEGVLQDVLKNFKNNQYQKASSSDVEGHWV